MQLCVQEAGGEEHEAPAQEEDVPDDTQDEYWTAVNQTDTWTYMHCQKTAFGFISSNSSPV